MTRISNVSTSFYKWMLPPLLVFVASSVALSTAILATLQGRWDDLQGIVLGSVAAAVIVVLMWRFSFYPLCDEVWDDGDHLILRKKGIEARVPLANIRGVRCHVGLRLERVSLTLDQPTELGDTVRFLLPYRYWLFGKPAIYVDLATRCATARVAGEA